MTTNVSHLDKPSKTAANQQTIIINLMNCPTDDCRECTGFYTDSVGLGSRIFCHHECHKKLEEGLVAVKVPAHSVHIRCTNTKLK